MATPIMVYHTRTHPDTHTHTLVHKMAAMKRRADANSLTRIAAYAWRRLSTASVASTGVVHAAIDKSTHWRSLPLRRFFEDSFWDFWSYLRIFFFFDFSKSFTGGGGGGKGEGGYLNTFLWRVALFIFRYRSGFFWDLCKLAGFCRDSAGFFDDPLFFLFFFYLVDWNRFKILLLFKMFNQWKLWKIFERSLMDSLPITGRLRSDSGEFSFNARCFCRTSFNDSFVEVL